jgi:hypothetical protein
MPLKGIAGSNPALSASFAEVTALLQHCISVLIISSPVEWWKTKFLSYKTLVLFLSPRKKFY